MPKRKARHQGKRTSKSRRLLGPYVGNAVNRIARNSANNDDNRDEIIDPNHPVEKISNKKTLTKAKKTRFKKQKKFEKKVKEALSTLAPPSTFHETGNIVNLTNTGGAFVLRWQETEGGGGNNSSMIMHPGGLLGNASASVKTYPYAVADLLRTDANVLATPAVPAYRGAAGKQQFRTTAARMTIDFKSANRVLICDIYTFVANMDIIDVNFATPSVAWTSCQTASANGSARYFNANYSSGGSKNTRGETPLDQPNFGKYWKQETKTRFQMAANSNYQWVMPNVRTVTNDFETYDKVYAVKGKTQAVLMVYYTPITNDLGLGEFLMYMEINKTYHYKIIGDGDGPLGTTNAVQSVMLT